MRSNNILLLLVIVAISVSAVAIFVSIRAFTSTSKRLSQLPDHPHIRHEESPPRIVADPSTASRYRSMDERRQDIEDALVLLENPKG